MDPSEPPAGNDPGHDRSDAAGVFDAFLTAHPDALVAAMGPSGRLVPLPSSVDVRGCSVFPGRSAMEYFATGDRPAVVDAWARAQTEPVVEVEVHLRVDPLYRSSIRFFDLRAEHGVHVVALDTRNPALVLQAAGLDDGAPRVVAHVRRDAASTFLAVDDATTTLLGWTRDELVGRPTLDFVHPDDVENAIEGWLAMRGAGTDDVRSNVRLRRRDGSYVWLEVTNNNHLDDPDVGCVLSRMVDITEHMTALEALHSREQLLRRLAETLPIGICHLRLDGHVMHTNPPLVALLGPVDSVEALVHSVAPADRPLVQLAVEQAMQGRPVDIEVGVFHGYEERRCDLTLRTMTDDDEGIEGLVVCATDVTDRSRLRAELEHRASHDALSGCLNRAATVTALEHALRTNPRVVVAYIDLDHFKAVNDELGHAAGDELLRVAAARLRHVIRAQDRLGRIGGDEFVVICPQSGSEFEVAEMARRLDEAITGDVSFARNRIPLRASVGAAVSFDGETDAEALLGRADAAMYERKRAIRQRAALHVVPPADHG